MTDVQELVLATNLYRSAKARGVIDLCVVQALIRSLRNRRPNVPEVEIRRFVVRTLASRPNWDRPPGGRSALSRR